MLTSKKLEAILKSKYDMAVGEYSLKKLKDKITAISSKTMNVSGRSYTTGRKKTLKVQIKDLLS